ncbi:NAD(P)H-dependent oxidoreductase [Salinimonas marina]|uniref:FMN dependent NADH:quinone oxidoreductase n=1 Tax=Salinimonas marina TaxID=2785918 RepID=A0A7S9DWF9_9ALTE|nr:NAD(P)H-dependent oxidoreductase [Salinimonas marina]QPG05153.1 NAD(P)H-dependent oxidoreductase [Salinimonas marina]
MKNILVIKSSLNGAQGQSNQLVDKLVTRLQQSHATRVVTRDFAEQPLPHLTHSEMATWMSTSDHEQAQQHDAAGLSDVLISELKNSDTVVIGMPMYNFGVPSTFKAWIDRIARAGVTFNYTESGPVGLLDNKTVYVVAARGGFYAGTSADSQTSFLKSVFGLIGLHDVQFIYAEGLNTRTHASQLAQAEQAIHQINL